MNDIKLMKRRLRLAIVMTIMTACHSAQAVAAVNYSPTFIAGYGFTNADTQQTIRLANTPEPGLSNHYFGASRLYGSALFGLAFENLYETALHGFIGHVGVEVDYLRNNAVNGRVQPLVNVAPDFDQLRYAYDIHSLILELTSKLTKENLLPQLDGYLQAGVGAALNRLSNYHEYAPPTSTASPMLVPFANKDRANAMFSAGFGVSHKMGQYTRASFGYRYIYAGEALLGPSPAQQTHASITLSPISYHVLILTLSLGQV